MGYELDDTPSPEFQLDDPQVATAVPPVPVVQNRAAKLNYALGADSPGTDNITQTILAGNEPQLRQTLADTETSKFQQTKQKLLTDVAQNVGGDLTPDDHQTIQAIQNTNIRPDPSSILENKFSIKYINDAMTLATPKSAIPLQSNPKVATQVDLGSEVHATKEWMQTQYENQLAEVGKQSYISYGLDFLGQQIPFLPWWRQAQALDRPSELNFGKGQTVRDNIAYIWALPTLELRQAAYNKAMDYLKAHNQLEALEFAQAMVSYSTSNEFLDNLGTAMDVAAVVGAPALKAVKGALRLPEPLPGWRGPMGPMEPFGPPKPPPPATPKPPAMGTEQLDLFGTQPEQGSFRFMNQPEQQVPSQVSKLPPGRMRAMHITDFDHYEGGFDLPANTRPVPPNGLFRDQDGKIRRSSYAYRQGEFPFDTVQHQLQFELTPPQAPPTLPPSTGIAAQVIRDAIKVTEGTDPPVPHQVVAAVGDVKTGGFIDAVNRILNPFGTGNDDVLKEVPTWSNWRNFFDGSKVITREYAQRIQPFIENSAQKLADTFANAPRVSRLTPEQIAALKPVAEQAMLKEYGNRLNDAVTDFLFYPAETHPANVDTLALRVHQPDGSLFRSPEAAKEFATDRGITDATVRPQGSGYWLEIAHHLDETSDLARNMINVNNKSNTSLISALLGRLRSAEDLFSKFQRDNRHIATHAPQAVRAQVRQFVKENFESLPKQSRQRLMDILRQNRDEPSRFNPMERGKWYNSAAELEQAWTERFGSLPTEKEVVAYDQYRRLSDFDWLIRNAAVYRDKARQGIQSFRYRFGATFSPSFEGKMLDAMPWSLGKQDQDAGIWVHDSSTGQGKFYYKFGNPRDPVGSQADRKYIDDLIENKGYKVVQIFDPKEHPLQGIAKTAAGDDLQDQVNYVITNAWEKSPLSWKQVDYRPGGHVIYPHDWYVAQPVIRTGRHGANEERPRYTYLGDNNILNVKTEAQAAKWAERLDTARQMLRVQHAGLEDYLAKNMPEGLNTREALEQKFIGPNAPLSLDHPVVYKQAGKNTVATVTELKAEYKDMVDATKNVHDLSNFMDKSYLLDRDNILSTVLENSGAIRLADAEQLDPYAAMNRAFGQNLRNMWLNDYKITAIESWFKEFSRVLQPSERTMFAHPTFFMYNPQYKAVSDVAFPDLMAAKTAQNAIVSFIGKNTELGQSLNTLKLKLLNTIYNKVGDGKMLDIALATTTDPVQFLRGVAFHSKLGLFNPVQMFVQMNTMAHSIAVAGLRNGGKGFVAAPLIRWLGHNPNMLDTVANFSKTFGWEADHFKEMYSALQRSGLYQVAGEAALRDDAFDPHLFRSTAGVFLDAGTMFFNEGERLSRLSAFATSYQEWKAANPGVKLGNRELGSIMRRSDDLSLNMTRASNASWQSGVLSLPTQFFTFNARAMEQLLGGRLTGLEKLRMISVYSALYGIPLGAGVAVGGVWPAYDSIKEAAMQRGINLNEGYLKVLSEGLLAQATSWATGHDYNIGPRYAPGNQTAIRDALNGDKSLLDLIGGAGGTIAGDFLKAMWPFYSNLAAVFSGDNDAQFPIQSGDWLNLFRNIGTADIIAKSYGAAIYGQWLTKTGTEPSKADGMDAAMAALGLSPREATDAYLGQRALKDQRQAKNFYIQRALEAYRFSMQAAQSGDYTAMTGYQKQARAAMLAGDLNFEDQAKLREQAAKQTQTLADKVNWDAVKQAPQSLFPQFLQNYFNRQ